MLCGISTYATNSNKYVGKERAIYEESMLADKNATLLQLCLIVINRCLDDILSHFHGGLTSCLWKDMCNFVSKGTDMVNSFVMCMQNEKSFGGSLAEKQIRIKINQMSLV